MEITEDQAWAYILRKPLPPEVKDEIERTMDDPESTVMKIGKRVAGITRRLLGPDEPMPWLPNLEEFEADEDEDR